MSTSIVRYEEGPQGRWGLLAHKLVRRIEDLAPGASCSEFVAFWNANPQPASWRLGESVALHSLRLLSPVTPNQQLIFQVGNFHSHLRDVGVRDTHKAPNTFFAKAASALAPPIGTLKRPTTTRLLDYEVELGLVLRSALSAPTCIAAAELHRWVAGITIVNDFSARDTQLRDGQNFRSKSQRGCCPVGPILLMLSAAEFDRLNDLVLELRVNGEQRQHQPFSDIVHAPHTSLSELSEAIDLAPGDLLATGTPGGCAIRAPAVAVQRLVNLLPDAWKWSMFLRRQETSGRYLQPGDLVEASIRTPDGLLNLGQQAVTIA